MAMKCLVLALALGASWAHTLEQESGANPIRKVVTLLQNLQKRVEAEGKAEQELYDKYMCYCKNGASTLGSAVADAETKVPQVESDIKEGESKKAQLEEDLKTHRADRDAAKSAIKDATSIREKEAGAYAKEKADADANIGALNKAVAAIEKGVSGGFLQTDAAQVVRKLMVAKQDIIDADRKEVLAFLSSAAGSEYSPQSGEITGILKQISADMSKSLADATAEEKASIKNYGELMAAKKKEIAAATAAIETKTARVGELGVSIVQMKNDLSDTQEQMMEDRKFLGDLDSNCASKKAEWATMQKTRAEEMVALAETIKILNDDDALELFKKTLATPSASFVQVRAGRSARARALAIISKVAHPQLDFITLALHGKKIGFDKVIKMIDNMVATLKREQSDDDNKKENCNMQFDQSDDKKKALERSVSDLETAIADAEEGISSAVSEIATLKDSIKALDKSVAEATEQRKAENADYKELISQNSAAKKLLGIAKNRLNKFYNPKLYKAPAKKELTEAERIEANMAGASLVQISSHKDAPAPPPAAPSYSKKSEESTGVLAMIDLLVKDLDKEITEAETEEKDAQADYEKTMQDSAEKRALDTKALIGKESTKADLEADLESHKENKVSTGKELGATMQYIHSLHNECDWLLKYAETRKEARSSEIDALNNAKAILSGADFSLAQTAMASKRLRGHQ